MSGEFNASENSLKVVRMDQQKQADWLSLSPFFTGGSNGALSIIQYFSAFVQVRVGTISSTTKILYVVC